MGIKQLKAGRIQGFVTAGNTGALILASSIWLEKLPQISKPALLATFPRDKTPLVIVDAGGNISCKAEHFLQFAKMGVAYQEQVFKCHFPKVGLLNIGQELGKGHNELRQAWQLFNQEEIPFHFVGNVESRSLFSEEVDVLVTDGFTGNILIKAAEGVASHLLSRLKAEVSEAAYQKLAKTYDYTNLPGAILCGFKEIVIKCHGEGGEKSFLESLKACYQHLSILNL